MGVVAMAGWRVTTGDLSVGQLVSVIGVAVSFTEPIQSLTMAMMQIFRDAWTGTIQSRAGDVEETFADVAEQVDSVQ